jgi:hypothetical protein
MGTLGVSTIGGLLSECDSTHFYQMFMSLGSHEDVMEVGLGLYIFLKFSSSST